MGRFGFPRRRSGTPPASITPLTIVTPPVISGGTTIGSTLTVATPAVWSGTPASRLYQWYRGAAAISGETGTSYVTAPADDGLNITVKERANNGSLSIPSPSNAIGPIGALTAPVLSVFNGTSYVTSATGVSGAPQFQMTIPSDVGEGDYVEEQIDTVNTFNSGGLLDEERILQWDGVAFQLANSSTFVPGNFSIDSGLPSSTTLYVRRRFRRDYGDTSIYSSWSGTVTITTAAASSAVLATVDGLNKNSLLGVSGSPALTFTATAGNALNCARTIVVQASSKAEFEVTQVSGGATANYVVGLDDGTTDLNTNAAPGYSNSAGIAINIALGVYIFVDWNSSGNTFAFANNVAGTIQDGDTFTFEFDSANHTMDCWRTRSGVLTKIGGQATGLPTLSSYHAFAGSINTTVVGVMNFGATTYAKTPGAGVAAYWG